MLAPLQQSHEPWINHTATAARSLYNVKTITQMACFCQSRHHKDSRKAENTGCVSESGSESEAADLKQK